MFSMSIALLVPCLAVCCHNVPEIDTVAKKPEVVLLRARTVGTVS